MTPLHYALRFSLPLMSAALLAASAHADSPLPGIVEYQQQITFDCASEQDAANLSLAPLPLPRSAKLAFSARWDDSTPAHFRTHGVMTRNGIKGTFYLNGWTNPKFSGAGYCSKLLGGGCSIGAHTKTHPSLPSINANEQFYEIMSVRVKLENDSNSPVSTMVLPFCRYGNSSDRQIQRDLGQAMMNSGFIGAPEPYYGKYEKIVGYPQGTLAESLLITPGDRSVSAEKYNNTVQKYLGATGDLAKKLARNPSMSVGIHSWHNQAGLKTLDELLHGSANEPNWWYCNQNEYAAYRFEANNCKVTKTSKGTRAVFTVTRFTPESLGARVDFWLAISGCQKLPTLVGPAGAKLDSGMLQLPHAAEQKIPEVIAAAGADGTTEKLPSLKCIFTVNDSIKPSVTLENTGESALSDVIVTLRSGPGFAPGVIVQRVSYIAPGDSFQGSWVLRHKDEVRYNVGRPYCVAQFDFNLDGKRCRLYAEHRGEASKKTLVPSSVVQAFLDADRNADLATLSMPDSSLADLKLKTVKTRDADILSPNAVAFSVSKADAQTVDPPPVIVAFLDFIPEQAGKIYLEAKADAMFLNGNEIGKDKAKRWVLPVVAGRNRLAFQTTSAKPSTWETRFLYTTGVKISEFCQISN